MNNVDLIGRLTKKAELYQTPDKRTYARFTLAINRKKKAGGAGNDADFIPCIIWGKAAEKLEQEIMRKMVKSTLLLKFGQISSKFFQVLHKPNQEN